jgi:antitoxin component YwqK of YwqJK toxin-antitoxin module
MTTEYVKYFFEDGSIKAEGWINGEQKENYWYFYYPNQKMKAKGSYKQNRKEGYWYYFNEKGSIEKEGHYKEDIATSWWRYYEGDSVMTVELQDGKREGLALYKVNGKPVKAEYYFNDERTHEWFSLQEYRNDKADLNHLENQ